jgi:hypothetical protein
MNKGLPFIPIFLCAFTVVIFAAGNGIFADLIEITESARIEQREWIDKQYLLEKDASIALEKGDDNEFVRLQKQILTIDRRIRESKGSALRKMQRDVDRGIVIPVEQESYGDVFTITKCHVKEVYWNPSGPPSVTLEAEIIVNRDLSNDNQKFHMVFLSQTGDVVTETFFRLPVGTKGSNIGKDGSVKLYSNVSIHELENVVRGLFKRER